MNRIVHLWRWLTKPFRRRYLSVSITVRLVWAPRRSTLRIRCIRVTPEIASLFGQMSLL